MIATIIILVSVLILLNFLLLKFSCNKIVQRKNTERPYIISKRPTAVVTTQQLPNRLAPTGS
jgi:hypothetical protein